MLTLPNNWRKMPAGEATLRLLAQIPERTLRADFIRNLIPASLELAQAAPLGKRCLPLPVRTLDASTWCVGDVCYKYLPVVDDEAMCECERLASEESGLFVIVPRGRELLLRLALKQVLGHEFKSVFSTTDFISWRTSLGTLDARWSAGRTLLHLLARYNWRAREAKAPSAILVDLPLDPFVATSTTQIQVPTYDPESEEEYDYGHPSSLTLQQADGLRVVMGEPDDEDAPDVLIERTVDMWRVFVHPDRSDPLCIIEIRKGRATVEDESGNLLLERALR
jgi:hypothetical protein